MSKNTDLVSLTYRHLNVGEKIQEGDLYQLPCEPADQWATTGYAGKIVGDSYTCIEGKPIRYKRLVSKETTLAHSGPRAITWSPARTTAMAISKPRVTRSLADALIVHAATG